MKLIDRILIFVTLAGGILLAAAGCTDRASPAAQSPATQPTQADRASATNTEGKSSASEHSPVAASMTSAAAGPVRDITFDTIKFNIQKDEPFVRSMLTPSIEKMHNTPVRIRGFILPSFQQSGLTQFVLVRDNMACCFGPGALLCDCIVVEMKSGKTADFTTRPVAVEGVFSINELHGPDDRTLAVYHLQADRVR